MKALRISAVIPNYNHAQFLPRCLDGFLQQTVPPLEIIVVDDASKDNSREVLAAYAARHPVVRFHLHEKNQGVCATINDGLRLAQGEYIHFCAADDEVKPRLFEVASEMLSAHPEAGFCAGMAEWQDPANGLQWYIGTAMPSERCYLSPAAMVALGRRGTLDVSGQNAVFKKSALIEAGGWIPELRWFLDWFGAYVVGFRHGICHVPEVLSVFNLSPTSYYNSSNQAAARREVLDHLLGLLESPAYADVAPRIVQSGVLGTFGWPLLRVAGSRRKHWHVLNGIVLRRAARRCAEVAGRRFFPSWLARWCLTAFYGAKASAPSSSQPCNHASPSP